MKSGVGEISFGQKSDTHTYHTGMTIDMVVYWNPCTVLFQSMFKESEVDLAKNKATESFSYERVVNVINTA